jgi:MFS family permease
MIAGVRHLAARRPAARAIGLVMVHRMIFGIAVALTVLQVRGALHPDDPEAAIVALTLTTGAAGLGAFLGALSTPRASRRFGAVHWSASALVVGVVIGAVGVATGTLPGLLVEGLFVGFAGQAVKVCSDTIVQEDVDDDRRGRVFALYDVGVNVAIVIGLTAAALAAPPDGVSPFISAWMGALAVLGAWWALTAERRDPARDYAADPIAIPGHD